MFAVTSFEVILDNFNYFLMKDTNDDVLIHLDY